MVFLRHQTGTLVHTDGLDGWNRKQLLLGDSSARNFGNHDRGLPGLVAGTVVACGAYLSYLWFIPTDSHVDPDEWPVLILRASCIPMGGFLTYQLPEANRAKRAKRKPRPKNWPKPIATLEEAEAQVRRADRLAALGQLTAGLAHELRNPLGTMKTSAEMLLENRSRPITKSRARWPATSRRSGPHQFADHALSGFRAAAASAAGKDRSARAARSGA